MYLANPKIFDILQALPGEQKTAWIFKAQIKILFN